MSSIVARVAPGAKETLSVLAATFEQLIGKNQPFAFGLADIDNVPLREADVALYVVQEEESASGPYPTSFRDVPGVPMGAYVASVDLTESGVTSFVVVTRDGRQAGLAAVPVVEPADSRLPAPGSRAVVVATATLNKRRGVDDLCTRDPRCGMHEVSLDQALRDGRPVMLTFATPAYCQTAMCGPSVDTVEGVRTSGDFGDTAWIHVEIYEDAGQTLAQPVREWGLPSEPWLFAIGAGGRIVARSDGPLLVFPDHVRSMAAQVARS